MAGAAEVLKDLLGLLGAMLAAWPWFREFRLRQILSRSSMIEPADPKLRKVKARKEAELRHMREEPSMTDLACQVGGLVLIGVSFLIGLAAALLA